MPLGRYPLESTIMFHERRAMTLIELLVATAIIVILLAISLPAVQQARQTALQILDANHVRQLGLAAKQHDATLGRLFGPYTGGSSADDGWSLGVLLHSENNTILKAFDRLQP